MRITIPLLRPIILVTAIMSTNGTLQLFDESVNLTRGGPGNMTITMSHYIYNTMFTRTRTSATPRDVLRHFWSWSRCWLQSR